MYTYFFLIIMMSFIYLTVHLIEECHESREMMPRTAVLQYSLTLLVPLLASVQQRFQKRFFHFFLKFNYIELLNFSIIIKVLLYILTSIIAMQIFPAGSANLRLSTTLSKICFTRSIKARAFSKFGSVKHNLSIFIILTKNK